MPNAGRGVLLRCKRRRRFKVIFLVLDALRFWFEMYSKPAIEVLEIRVERNILPRARPKELERWSKSDCDGVIRAEDSASDL